MYICVFQSPGQIRSDVKSQSLLPAVNAALLELVAKQAAKNNDFTRINSDLKKQLDALNEALAEDNAARKEPASLLYQVRDDSVNMETSVDTGRASQDELEDEIEDMKTLMMLSANLQFQHEENQKLEKHWKVMHDALLDCEEKLGSTILEQEDLVNQITETKEKLSAEMEAVKVCYIRSFGFELYGL